MNNKLNKFKINISNLMSNKMILNDKWMKE